MDKKILLNILGLTEEQIIQEAAKINLSIKELEVFNNGKKFLDNYNELNNKELQNRVTLKLIEYGFSKRYGGNCNE